MNISSLTPGLSDFHTIQFLAVVLVFFCFYFIEYILLIMLLQLSHFPPLFPSILHPPPASISPPSPQLSSCPWVIHMSSLASTFPILFLTSSCLFSIYHLCFFLYLFPHTPPFLLITLHAE
ncbi:hypothetical protein HJG60_011038 [Phyllostomus discolor]|uniref:Uncharacterized protein n=1 Tax=Phyllostomus discolor TaxID=89673 RepID=A0A834AEF9_9CHIR|nr:hypothetical protein HJG60_011038 [Phyllostomus discolor]